MTGAETISREVPCGTSTPQTPRRGVTCSGCDGERDRPGQAYCRKCHTGYMAGYRARKALSRKALRDKLALLALMDDADAIRAELRRLVGRRALETARQQLKAGKTL